MSYLDSPNLYNANSTQNQNLLAQSGYQDADFQKAIQASLGNDEESQLNAAILASIRNDSYEPLNPG